MATYMSRKIEEVTECFDGTPTGSVEVTASIGEFDGILLAIEVPGSHESVELDFTQAHKLMLALQDALNILAEADDVKAA